MGRTYSKQLKPSGHTEGGRRPGQTRKKPKDLSACDHEERRSGEGEGVYAVTVCADVSEEYGNGEGAVLQDLSRLSADTCRYISLAADSVRGWGHELWR